MPERSVSCVNPQKEVSTKHFQVYFISENERAAKICLLIYRAEPGEGKTVQPFWIQCKCSGPIVCLGVFCHLWDLSHSKEVEKCICSQSIYGQIRFAAHSFSGCKLFILLISFSNSSLINWKSCPLHNQAATQAHRVKFFFCVCSLLSCCSWDKQQEIWSHWNDLYFASQYLLLLTPFKYPHKLFYHKNLEKDMFFCCLICTRWETVRLLVGFKSSP